MQSIKGALIAAEMTLTDLIELDKNEVKQLCKELKLPILKRKLFSNAVVKLKTKTKIKTLGLSIASPTDNSLATNTNPNSNNHIAINHENMSEADTSNIASTNNNKETDHETFALATTTSVPEATTANTTTTGNSINTSNNVSCKADDGAAIIDNNKIITVTKPLKNQQL